MSVYASETKARELRNKQIRRKQKKSAAKKTRQQKVGVLTMAAVVVIILALSIPILGNWSAIWEKNREIAALRQDYNSRRIQNDALQQKVDAPIDDEYIIDAARAMGYRKSDEILFYFN